ncbi:MAG TPA: hypothetical protein VKU62_12910 [Thermoanaerobaculia bacterium]|nr:hypothetical protein [Thermoanaerobaculia bacterium]
MRIVEQSDDRLVIEDRKTAPMWQPAFAVAFLTLPLLLPRSWLLRALVVLIWAITARRLRPDHTSLDPAADRAPMRKPGARRSETSSTRCPMSPVCS